jgi:hypothetical protein
MKMASLASTVFGCCTCICGVTPALICSVGRRPCHCGRGRVEQQEASDADAHLF